MLKKLRLLVCSLATIILITPADASEKSVGENGINALILQSEPYNFTGRKIAIGQVEIGRPPKFGFDKLVSNKRVFDLAGVFFRDSPAKSNLNLDNHAAMVASVMISQDKLLKGVAPDAQLYSAAVGNLKRDGQAQECLASQNIAEQNGGDVRAINFSFGESLERDPRDIAILDGNALLTQCIDWSARVHDVLYVIAGNQGSGGIPIPTDNYNGISTAYTTQRNGKFVKVDFANLSSYPRGIGRRLIEKEINFGPRRAISLVAPGSQIEVYSIDGKKVSVSGTSFAAPHITGSVALLQEAGDRFLSQAQPNWSLDSRRHEVMKAVLLNSADKIEDTGDGLLLGMTRTVLTKSNRNYFESDAYTDDKIPLDIEMGAGHLNTYRAYLQFSAGQYSPDKPVPHIGWNYGQIQAESYQEYVLEQPLKKDGYVSITLAWNRFVELNDTNNNQKFDVGESFSDRGLNNLDIYLMPVNAQDTVRSVCSSVSEVDSTEQIFCPIPHDGRYKIRVVYRNQVNENVQPYALAWWTVPK